jgi:hypothetical protein
LEYLTACLDAKLVGDRVPSLLPPPARGAEAA